MVAISEEFRAGWEATKDHLDGVAAYDPGDNEKFLQKAWDAHCGTQTPRPVNFDQQFAHDWNNMIATVAEICTQYGMRRPDMIFHPEWRRAIFVASAHPISDTLVHMGVRVRFGTWQQVDALRQM